ncbi:MAG: hypothetical protein AMXMBFR47_19790 [Planctomycetota bacterium]
MHAANGALHAFPRFSLAPQLECPVTNDAKTLKQRIRGILFLLFWLAAIVAVPVLAGGSTVIGAIASTLLSYSPFVLVFVGIAVLRRARRRIGSTRRCRKCDYQQAPDADPGPRCPECGADWSAPDGIIRGDRQPHGTLRMWTGIVTLAAGVALIALQFTAPLALNDWLSRRLPTSVLIEQAITTKSFDRSEWSALSLRLLTPEQERRLAGGLLDAARQRGHLSHGASAWFTTMLAGGRLPSDLRDRYYREMLRVEIDAPAEVIVGERFEIELRSSFRSDSGPSTADEVVYFDGFYLRDRADPIAPNADGNYAILFSDTEAPRAMIHADTSGTLHIRAVLWLAVGPDAMQVGQWQPGHPPVFPPGKVDWLQRIEVERAITVRPADAPAK